MICSTEFAFFLLLLLLFFAFGSGAKDIPKKMCLKTATATVDEIELLKPIFYILFSIQAAFSHFFRTPFERLHLFALSWM